MPINVCGLLLGGLPLFSFGPLQSRTRPVLYCETERRGCAGNHGAAAGLERWPHRSHR